MLRLYNTLSRTTDEIRTVTPGLVRMYTCGPTVYRDVHIGNLRSYLMADWIRRTLEYQQYEVLHVKNITDVGHMRQEMLEQGEDKVIAEALAKGRTPQEIAQHYTDSFHRDEEKVNILPARYFPKATDHVPEMVSLTETLLGKGSAYEVNGNVYFDVDNSPSYGKLSGNTGQDMLTGVRMEADPQKRDPRDFTLWKAAEPGRELKWPSPWGDGFPGWHIECSAMAVKYLGTEVDLHTGGVDNIFPHHEGELAQSEGAYSEPYVRCWTHGQHLLADGTKMAKSAANDYTLSDLESRGFDPLALRYLCLTVRYRTRLNFTFSALRAAQKGLQRLRNRVWEWSIIAENGREQENSESWRTAFLERINDNLDMPGALVVTWAAVGSELDPATKLKLLLEFDQVLGLGLSVVPERYQPTDQVRRLVAQRQPLRGQSLFEDADRLRTEAGSLGYVVEDTSSGSRVRPKSELEKREQLWRSISSPREVPSLLSRPDELDFSVNIVARDHLEDIQRCVEGVLEWGPDSSIEAVVVDNGAEDSIGRWLEGLSKEDSRLRVFHADHVLGEAQARNICLAQSLGKNVVLLDTSVELKGDIFTPIAQALAGNYGGVVGPWGLRSEDFHHFHEEITDGLCDAMQLYCFAFPRGLVSEIGLLRESFRFYRNLDIDYSFHFKDKGYSIRAIPNLPLERHTHREWERLSHGERDKLSRVNWKRMFKKWGHRKDLLTASHS